MRPSHLKHTLAILRTTIGITQKEMAEIAGCSTPTIQAIELGKLAMSHKFAENLCQQTGINYAWIMNDDVSKLPVDGLGTPFSRETFEKQQAFLLAPAEDSSDVRRDLFFVRASFRCAVEQLAIIFKHAYQNNHAVMCNYKVRSALRGLMASMVPVQKLTLVEEDQLSRFRLHRYKIEDLQAPVKRFVDDTDAIFQTRITEHEPGPPSGHHPEDALEMPPSLRGVWRKKQKVERRKLVPKMFVSSGKQPNSPPKMAPKKTKS